VIAMAELTKTGDVYYRDVDGRLHFAETFEDEAGVVSTTDTVVEEEPEPAPAAG